MNHKIVPFWLIIAALILVLPGCGYTENGALKESMCGTWLSDNGIIQLQFTVVGNNGYVKWLAVDGVRTLGHWTFVGTGRIQVTCQASQYGRPLGKYEDTWLIYITRGSMLNPQHEFGSMCITTSEGRYWFNKM